MPIPETAAEFASRSTTVSTVLGIIPGVLLGLPPALCVQHLGFAWFPYGLAAMLIGLFVGQVIVHLIAILLVDMETTSVLPSRPPRSSVIARRLTEEKLRLEALDAERDRLHDYRLGKDSEQRIIWGELLDLELQDLDDQVRRICSTAGRM